MRNPLDRYESELDSERDAIQDEGCDDEELDAIRLARSKGKAPRRYLIPQNATVVLCHYCGCKIVWRKINNTAVALDVASATEDTDGSRMAVGHWRFCTQ